MIYNTLITSLNNRILTVTINRENKLNALNKETLDELHKCLNEAFSNEAVGGIIITGAGKKSFVAGADIAEFQGLNAEEASNLSKSGHTKVFDLIENGPKPVIAAVNGFALGGGLELAMACHIRIVSDNARFGLPEVTLGLIPGYGGTQRLPQLVGKGKAIEMILSAQMIDANEAFRIGLANQVVTLEELLPKSAELLTVVLSRAPLAVAAAIRAINAGYTDGINGFQTEIEQFGGCFTTNDIKEGVSAFLEKRVPKFCGN
ncbi:enoyl-CoA hydratase [Pedobacter sp. HMF7647]|uniref:Enoyl-CoA hydratase n=1 Tax=Hufsiella arboris TaxID=2695275 RepID=A0A7K1Y4Z0_9SPHI|nr:enoyl-CoA hydratase-related protein [Hufsiella arboris]MXV49646.1 enoyl-CoA hydratase [Hufsiella arboris]